MPKEGLQKHSNQDHCIGKRPCKSTPVSSILHKEIQTYPQLLRGMQRIRGPFVLVTVLTYVDRPFVQWHSFTRALYSFPFHICTYCFISFTYLPHSYAFSHLTVHSYIGLRGIFFLSLMMPLIGESLDFRFNFYNSVRPHLILWTFKKNF